MSTHARSRDSTYCLAVGILFLASLGVAHAQPAAETRRIGVMSPLAAAPEPPTVRAFRGKLRELGYVDGKNVTLITRFAAGRPELMPELFAEMVRLKVDVIVAGSAQGALAAKKATTSIPIVFTGVLDPVSAGIVLSLARPAGNITGTTFGAAGSGIAAKWAELLKELSPRLSHVAILASSTHPETVQMIREIEVAAKTLNMKATSFDAINDTTLDQALDAIIASRAQGIIVTIAPFFGAKREKLVQFAADQRLPAVYFFNLFPDAGGLMSYGGSLEESWQRAAVYVDKILKGARPGDLPIDQPTRFELVINLKAARAIGITIPRSLLLRADRLVE